MKYDTIVFDLDGTLVNTLDDITDSVNAVMVSEGYPQRVLEDIRYFVGEGYRVLMSKALPAGTEQGEIDHCTALFRKTYYKNIANKTKPYEGIPSLLQKLKKIGVKIGVVSNKLDEATKEACRFYFGPLIDIAIGENPERKNKPAPDNVYEVLAQLGSSKENALYVGDSNVDVKTAKNAGVVCIGVTWGYRTKEILVQEGADYIIDNPSQLLNFFKN